MKHQEVIEIQHRRYATKKFNPNKKISEQDWEIILEAGRLSPSSLGLEPWKILLIKNDKIKQDLKEMAWGAVASLEGASHFVILLARKNVTPDNPYVAEHMQTVKGYDFKPDSGFAIKFKDFQANDAKLTTERRLFDWASKQTYIQMANMMTAAAMLDIDSCPIEGFSQKQVENYLIEKNLLDQENFGVSVMIGFGYRDQDITPKTRHKMEDIYQVIE